MNLSGIFTAKEPLNKRKRQHSEEEKYFKQRSPQRIHLQNIQTAQAAQYQKTKIPNKKWAKDLNGHFMKKAYRWPLST